MTKQFGWLTSVQNLHGLLSQNYPTSYVLARVILACSSVFAMHVFGYVHKLGIGVSAFVGMEVATDLLASIIYSFLKSLVVFFLFLFATFLFFEVLARCFDQFGKSERNSNFRLLLATLSAVCVFTLNYVDFGQWSASFGNVNSTFLFGISLFALCCAIVCSWIKIMNSQVMAGVLISFLFSSSYLLGEMRAGSVPDYGWRQIVFVDGSRLDGFPLHRVRDGFIFKKRDFFAFDTGVVFVPFNSIKFITEPSRTTDGEFVLSRDYPSWIITAP